MPCIDVLSCGENICILDRHMSSLKSNLGDYGADATAYQLAMTKALKEAEETESFRDARRSGVDLRTNLPGFEYGGISITRDALDAILMGAEIGGHYITLGDGTIIPREHMMLGRSEGGGSQNEDDNFGPPNSKRARTAGDGKKAKEVKDPKDGKLQRHGSINRKNLAVLLGRCVQSPEHWADKRASLKLLLCIENKQVKPAFFKENREWEGWCWRSAVGGANPGLPFFDVDSTLNSSVQFRTYITQDEDFFNGDEAAATKYFKLILEKANEAGPYTPPPPDEVPARPRKTAKSDGKKPAGNKNGEAPFDVDADDDHLVFTDEFDANFGRVRDLVRDSKQEVIRAFNEARNRSSSTTVDQLAGVITEVKSASAALQKHAKESGTASALRNELHTAVAEQARLSAENTRLSVQNERVTNENESFKKQMGVVFSMLPFVLSGHKDKANALLAVLAEAVGLSPTELKKYEANIEKMKNDSD